MAIDLSQVCWWNLLSFLLMSFTPCYSHPSPHCAAYVAQYETQHQIPTGLLQAMAKVESGRKDTTGHLTAWPWTLNAAGKSYYFPTKEMAIAAVLTLQRKGIQSIDVGCMQINLYYHPHAFKSLEDAFDPAKNVAYAASFLTKLKEEHTSWYRAVSHYHSANPTYHIPYQKNVLALWNRERKEKGVVLAAGTFAPSFSSSPKIHRLRRLPGRKDNLEPPFEKTYTKAAVRRVTRASSRYLKRISSRSGVTRPS